MSHAQAMAPPPPVYAQAMRFPQPLTLCLPPSTPTLTWRPLPPPCTQITHVQAILASNTSSISITRLAAATNKPHRVVGGGGGMHVLLAGW